MFSGIGYQGYLFRVFPRQQILKVFKVIKDFKDLKNKKQENRESSPVFWLSYLDSNQERQNQNLLCYHYTIAQSVARKRLQR